MRPLVVMAVAGKDKPGEDVCVGRVCVCVCVCGGLRVGERESTLNAGDSSPHCV